MKHFEYYYNLEEVSSDRAAYCRKATSAGITAKGYAPNVAVASSKTNARNKDGEEAIDDDVPEDIWAKLDAGGVYNRPTDQSRLTSNTSTTAAKKTCENSENSSNKTGRKHLIKCYKCLFRCSGYSINKPTLRGQRANVRC